MQLKRLTRAGLLAFLCIYLSACSLVTGTTGGTDQETSMADPEETRIYGGQTEEEGQPLDPAYVGEWSCDYVTAGLDCLYEKSTYVKLKEDHKGILCLNGRKSKITWKKTENGFRIMEGPLFTFTDDGMCYTTSGGCKIFFSRGSGKGRYLGRWNGETVDLPAEYVAGNMQLTLNPDSSAELVSGNFVDRKGSCRVEPEGILLDLEDGSQWILDFEEEEGLSYEMEDYIFHFSR